MPRKPSAPHASPTDEAMQQPTIGRPDTSHVGARANQPGVDLKTLSRHLGLSKGTISRALNGYPEIAERTRARVLEAATQLGYSPNRAARRLATGRNDLISYIGVGSDWMTAERSFLSALSSTLADKGYGLMVSLADTMDHAEDTMRQLIDDRRVDGFVFNTAFPADARIALATEAGVPAVTIGGTLGDGERPAMKGGTVPTIGINDRAVLDGLVDFLNSLGHDHFAYFGCDAPHALQMMHSKTLAAACANRDATFQSDIRTDPHAPGSDGLFEPETAASLTRRAAHLLDGSPDRPTAVFCGCERTIVALYMAARDYGLSVPEELSIIGIGSSQLASWLSGGLSTVSWSLSEAGRLGADCVLALVDGRTVGDVQAQVEAHFVARASHGPAPRGTAAI